MRFFFSFFRQFRFLASVSGVRACLCDMCVYFCSQGVFDNAEATAAKYHLRMEEEREAREAAAKDIVMGLGDLDASTFDSASDLDQILAPSEAASE